MVKKEKRNSFAQVWVETVVYTMIGLALIGVILLIALPKIEELKDKNIIESTKQVLNEIDLKIEEVSLTSGNQRVVEADIKKGRINFNAEKDEISFYVDSSYKYSEVGLEVREGKFLIKTEGVSSAYEVTMKIQYSPKINLTVNSKEIVSSLEPSTKPYKIILLNKGNSTIDIRIEE